MELQFLLFLVFILLFHKPNLNVSQNMFFFYKTQFFYSKRLYIDYSFLLKVYNDLKCLQFKYFLNFTEKKYYFVFVSVILVWVGVCYCAVCLMCLTNRNTNKETYQVQIQTSRGVLINKRAENMQQIYRKIPMPKCDFNKMAKQLSLRTPLEVCFGKSKLSICFL